MCRAMNEGRHRIRKEKYVLQGMCNVRTREAESEGENQKVNNTAEVDRYII